MWMKASAVLLALKFKIQIFQHVGERQDTGEVFVGYRALEIGIICHKGIR
jgi:hypothetical protein